MTSGSISFVLTTPVTPRKHSSFCSSFKYVNQRLCPIQFRIEKHILPRVIISSRSKITIATTIDGNSLSIPRPSHPPHERILQLTSSVIGALVLVGSVLYKIPQVLRIIRRRSARGLSILYYALELVGMTFSFVYFARRNYPILSYGETCAVTVSNIIILALILHYGPAQPRWIVTLTLAIYSAAVFYLLSPFAPLSLLMTLQVLSIPLLNLAKVPQILKNHAAQSTGELSQLTLFLQLLGNIARIFTTLAQVRDKLMLASILVAFCFNSVLFGQWVMFSRPLPITQKS